ALLESRPHFLNMRLAASCRRRASLVQRLPKVLKLLRILSEDVRKAPMLEQKQQIYVFDNFRLDVPNRELSNDGRVVALPAKAFDMLVVLIENRGRLMEKDELFSSVWPDQIV